MNRPPNLVLLMVIWLVASVGVGIAGPFGTIVLPLSLRLPYWMALVGINMLKWTLWFHVGSRVLGHATRTMLLIGLVGVVVINLLLPLEVQLMSQWVGRHDTVPYWAVYFNALFLGLTGLAGMELIRWALGRSVPTVADAAVEPAPTPGDDANQPDNLSIAPDDALTAGPVEPPAGGLMVRAGISDPNQVLAVEAEDHYLRIYLADGRKPLILYRLRDALVELAQMDGEQVHRGYWVSGRAVVGLERRDGRKWALRLSTGLLVPVSTTFMPAVRKRGWQEMVN